MYVVMKRASSQIQSSLPNLGLHVCSDEESKQSNTKFYKVLYLILASVYVVMKRASSQIQSSLPNLGIRVCSDEESKQSNTKFST